jgi:4-hydroxybenzoate polyprenyltransferase
MLKNLALSLRPGQWVKNLVVLAALVFSQNLGDAGLAIKSLLALVIFCLLSSSVYLVNDIADRKSDRAHPQKKNRPIAAGLIKPATAALAAAFLGTGALAGAWLLNPLFCAVAAAYAALMVGYSFLLKRVVIADVFAIAAGFVLRAAAGAEAIGVPISDWLLVCVIMLALFLSLAKRRQELVSAGSESGVSRPVLSHYSEKLLDQMMAVAASGAVVCYSLYTLWPETVARLGTSDLKYTVPLVVFGIFRYLFLVYQRREGERPERVLLADPWILGDIMAYGVLVWYLLYR